MGEIRVGGSCPDGNVGHRGHTQFREDGSHRSHAFWKLCAGVTWLLWGLTGRDFTIEACIMGPVFRALSAVPDYDGLPCCRTAGIWKLHVPQPTPSHGRRAVSSPHLTPRVTTAFHGLKPCRRTARDWTPAFAGVTGMDRAEPKAPVRTDRPSSGSCPQWRAISICGSTVCMRCSAAMASSMVG